jgi:serine/threonine-protein kinase RsbW
VAPTREQNGEREKGGVLLHLSLPAEPASVPELRHHAAAFAKAMGADEELTADVALAVSEAVTNAVKYAYQAEIPGEVELAGTIEDGWLEIRIHDRGEGFGAGSSDGLGLGLSIIARLCGDLRIIQEGNGTEVQMRFPFPDGE